MPVRLLLIGGIFALAGCLTALAVYPALEARLFGTPAPQPSGKALIGGPFELVDQTGKTVTDADFKGRYLLVFFGFTHCPDVCPSGLQVIAAALDKLGTKADDIQPVFITLDPERDTPQKMAEYVKSFHPRLIGLSGSPEQVAKAVKAYRVYSKKVPGEGENYTIDHSSFTYLMGRDGSFLKHYNPSTDADALAQGIAKVL